MLVNSRKIINVMENIAPSHLADDWDNVGFLVGNQNKIVNKVLITLEITEAVIDEAVEKNVDLIICHHPLIFKPLKKIVDSNPISSMVLKLIKHDIGVYASHTNLDVAHGGIGAYVASLFPFRSKEIFVPTHKEAYVKLVAYIPKDHEEKIREALVAAGAGSIGNYSDCTFRNDGTGTFKPLRGARPFVGTHGEVSEVEEIRLETIVSKSILGKVLSVLIKNHPYETPAYDVIPLENEIEVNGVGYMGYLEGQHTLRALAEEVQMVFKSDKVKVAGDLDKTIRKIAIVNGSGDDFIADAIKNQCDVLITGDIKHHMAHFALENRVSIIDAGHHETEQIFMPHLMRTLKKTFEEKNYDIHLILSEVDTNPFKVLK